MPGDSKKTTILITGGAGFIGSNFIPYFLDKYSNYSIINIDKLTYAGDLNNLKEIENNKNYEFILGDICDQKLLNLLFKEYSIKGIINFAAESHVDNSIESPDVFIYTNINGAFNLLKIAYSYWMLSPGTYREGLESCRFHHISTDEVYGSLGSAEYFTEKTPYAPNSPYSASKASADMLVRSFCKTYGLNTVITNCSNNYGPKQHDEKLIPTIIRSAISLKEIPIYGDGQNIRDWLYVLDHCKAIDLVYHQAKCGETYNIGSRNEVANLDLARNICEILDELVPDIKNKSNIKSYKDLITFVKDRPGHDRRYAIDPAAIESKLGWKAEQTFRESLKNTIIWYLKNRYNIFK